MPCERGRHDATRLVHKRTRVSAVSAGLLFGVCFYSFLCFRPFFFSFVFLLGRSELKRLVGGLRVNAAETESVLEAFRACIAHGDYSFARLPFRNKQLSNAAFVCFFGFMVFLVFFGAEHYHGTASPSATFSHPIPSWPTPVSLTSLTHKR